MGLVVVFCWLERKLASVVKRLALLNNVLMVCQAFLMMLGLHILEIAIWATYYSFKGYIEGFETSLYYSFSAYTTVGYGDAVLPPVIRLLKAIETCVGLLLFGYSTALWERRKGWEQIAQTVCGAAELAPGGCDQKHLIAALPTDYGAGYVGAIGTIAALRRRHERGGFWTVHSVLPGRDGVARTPTRGRGGGAGVAGRDEQIFRRSGHQLGCGNDEARTGRAAFRDTLLLSHRTCPLRGARSLDDWLARPSAWTAR